MDTWAGLACADDSDFEVQFEIVSVGSTCDRERTISEGIADADRTLETLESKLKEYNKEIDRLTNQADGYDYALAVSSGIITGIIDSFLVGEWDFQGAKKQSNIDINNKILNYTKKDPRYNAWCKGVGKTDKWKQRDPDRLSSAVEFLEEKYVLPGDNDWSFKGSGVSPSSHHLDDFCHHPTLIGMLSSILVQFTGIAKYHTASGDIIALPVSVNEYGVLVSDKPFGKVFAGIINWFFNAAKTLGNQKGHLMSDMAGSISAVKGETTGAGVPGTIMATLKELSALPCFKDSSFAENLRKAYQNGFGSRASQLDLGPFNSLFEGASSKFDMRTEGAIKHELKRQAVPVIINEIIVRAFYCIRRFIEQVRTVQSISDIDWKAILPFKNRTIIRMLTIATGTFTAVDVADAAVRSAVKSGGIANPAFLGNMILRVNFVGAGRFAVAVITDASMGLKKEIVKKERNQVLCQMISVSNMKLYYVNADYLCEYAEMFESEANMHSAEAELWKQCKNTQQAYQELISQAEKVAQFYIESNERYYNNIENMAQSIDEMKINHPERASQILRRLEL